MKLIDKDALVAEIERLRKIQPTDEFQPKEQNKIDWLAGKEFAIISLQVFLDTLEVKEIGVDLGDPKRDKSAKHIIDTKTLEVKEVNLEKEFSSEDYIRFFEEHPNFPDDWGFDEAWVFAKYFFELGQKAQKGEEV